ncbi:MAG: hypothetical protein NZ529_10310 [Cytophagaceae bacterium]|nr:hypothetical protein [Cytophagaceae bacterium]MDW8457178.1 hypothetical protein [Cytophagaceae bacterium]
MKEYYPDMITSQRNFSFVDYPLANVGANNSGGFPMLELNLSNSPLSKFQFSVGYSFASTLTGKMENTDPSRQLSSRNNLRFGGKWASGPVRVSVDAGGILWTKVSRFTMGQTQYRDNYFDRVPWDWYRNSFLRYEEYYTLSTNIGAEGFGRSPLLGYVANVDILPLQMRLMGVYGRTNLSATVANSVNGFPSEVYAGRVEKTIFTRRIAGKVGFNYYMKNAQTDISRGIPDQNDMYTVDYNLKIYKILFSGEAGIGHINNPALKDRGAGFAFKTELDRSVTSFPIALEYYRIGVNMASIDGSILNSNTTIRAGGYATEFVYDASMNLNIMQEVGQIANNRHGFSLTGEKNIWRFKIQFGYAISQELKHISDTITMQHRVNAFSRSRFRPWFQASGPYGRIKGFWLRTFETITTDSNTTGLKGFNAFDLLLKYKCKFLNKDLVILNFINYNSVQVGFKPIPEMSDKAFVRLFYEDITLAYRLGKKYNIVFNAGVETMKGNDKTNLSPENGKPIDQFGYAYGGAIDYDFAPNAGIHFRHKWMSHKDKNFTLDRFKGQESYIELKIFF